MKGKYMKKVLITLALVASVAGCVDSEMQQHLEAERDFHAQMLHEQDRASHEAYLEWLYENHDMEYIDDCLYYEEVVCDFEKGTVWQSLSF